MKKFFYQSFFTGNKKWHSYLLAFVVMMVGQIVGSIPLMVWGVVTGNLGEDGQIKSIHQGDKNLVFAMMLLPFLGMLGGLWLAQKKVHARTFSSLLTSRASVDLGWVFFSFGLWGILNMVLQIIDFAFEPDFVFQFHFGRWIILFIVSVCLIPFQTSVEEIFMRGYLMQAIGNLTKYPIVGVLLSAGLFGAMHFWNPEVQKMGLPMAVYYYMGFGLVLGAITLLDEGLELALGFHAANNLFASIFVTFKDSSLQTDALVVDSEMNYTRTTILWTVCVCVYLFIVIRKYHFPSIQTLFQKQERMES